MNSPFRNYDAWLTTDRLAEAQEAAYELMLDAWTSAVDEYDLPPLAEEEDHPHHGLFVKWLAFYEACVGYHNTIAEEDYAAAIGEAKADEIPDWPEP